MDRIKLGFDGWKGIIAKDFTIANISRLAFATALWLTRKYKNSTVVIGFDCRFNGEIFMEAVAKILASKGVKIFIAENFVTVPMVSLGISKLKAQCGIIITAGHSPSEFNGYRLLGENGGTMHDKDLKDIEDLVSNDNEIDLELLNWNYMLENGSIMYLDMENIYVKELRDNFEIDMINSCGLKFACDAMYGSAQNVMKKVFPSVMMLHADLNPSFRGIPPDPTRKNLHELIEMIWRKKDIDCSFATDGAGEKIALFDNEANYLDANMSILLLIHYLAGYLQQKGKVVVSFPVSSRVDKLCLAYDLEVIRSRAGFPDISKLMSEDGILLIGDESGSISFKKHLPQGDAIWTGVTLFQWMVKYNKTLAGLCSEVTGITGSFAYEKAGVEMNRNSRTRIMERCSSGSVDSFGRFRVDNFEIFDGCKFFFENERWLLIRSIPAEPIIQLYAEAENEDVAREIIYSAIKVIMEIK